jgi:diacylglycerol kinase family enzyme
MGNRKRLWRWLLAGVVIGLVMSGWFWREGVRSLVSNATSYRRRRIQIKSPALIINRWSGDGKAQQVGLAEVARKQGIRVIMLERGDDLIELAHDAISTGADAIGMAGGDGSLGLVAGVAIERNVPFFCIPVGTRNHFALDLGVDRDDPLAALAAVDQGEEITLDYGTVNGRVFLNNVSLGIYAIAVHRAGYREAKLDTMSAVVKEAAEAPDSFPPLRFATPDGKRHERAPLVLISNNPYIFTGPPDFGRRRRLDAGRLGVTAVTSLAEGADITAELLADLPNRHEWDTGSFRVESDTTIQAGVDGEALEFSSPLNAVIQPKGLRVLVPRGTEPGYVPLRDAFVARLLDLAQLGGEDDDSEGVEA